MAWTSVVWQDGLSSTRSSSSSSGTVVGPSINLAPLSKKNFGGMPFALVVDGIIVPYRHAKNKEKSAI